MTFNFEKFKKMYDREVNKLMRDAKVPGFSVLITRDSEIVYERSYGSREWQNGKPANSDTLYGIASITKSMTSVAILQLQEKGKLSIEDPISKYIPVDLDIDKENPIRIKHLMAHASGIPNLWSYATQIKNEDLTTINTQHLPMGNWDDFYFHVNDAKDWVLAPPETKFYYNNDGYIMLSQIVGKVSGIEYEQYMRENVFAPMNMVRSTFSRDDLEKDDNVSKGYSSDPSEKGIQRKPKPHMSGPLQSGPGGLNSSVNELTNYMKMHLKKGKFEDTRVIGENFIELMWQPHNKNMTSENLFLPNRVAYGFGLSIYDFHGYTLISHGGASGVAGGVIGFIPELNITYTHLYNVGWFTSHMMFIALSFLIGKDPYTTLPFFKRRDHFKKLVGTYLNYRGLLEYKIVNKNGIIHIVDNVVSENTIPLFPVDVKEVEPMEFYEYGGIGRSKIVFTELDDKSMILEVERNVLKKKSYEVDLEKFQ